MESGDEEPSCMTIFISNYIDRTVIIHSSHQVQAIEVNEMSPCSSGAGPSSGGPCSSGRAAVFQTAVIQWCCTDIPNCGGYVTCWSVKE